eukprot:scaffold176310_cov22-Prasinocladus_malaysianus.AAC.1
MEHLRQVYVANSHCEPALHATVTVGGSILVLGESLAHTQVPGQMTHVRRLRSVNHFSRKDQQMAYSCHLCRLRGEGNAGRWTYSGQKLGTTVSGVY